MMSQHPNEEKLNDWVDGQLPAVEREQVERHLGDCPQCMRAVEELQSLLGRAAELPDVDPSRDLWPGIREAARPPRGRRAGWVALAASVLLLAALGVWRFGGGSPDAFQPAEPSIETLLAEVQTAERQYAAATARLLSAIDARRDEIPPETLTVLDENLRILDEAIDEVRASLDEEGAGPGDGHALTTLYAKKLQLLWRASRLAS